MVPFEADVSRDRDFIWRWADRAAREIFPSLLGATDEHPLAERMRAVPPVSDRETLMIAYHAVRGVVLELRARGEDDASTWTSGALLLFALEELSLPAPNLRRVRAAFEAFVDSAHRLEDRLELRMAVAN
jgi:hypothetical protein